MRSVDRWILSLLSLGIWILAGSFLFSPGHVSALDAGDIDDLDWTIRRVVQRSCDVYVYDISGSEGYGDINC